MGLRAATAALRWAGVAIGLPTVAIGSWTFRSLGRNITDTVVTRREHALITSGPYRYVRHPFHVTTALAFAPRSARASSSPATSTKASVSVARLSATRNWSMAVRCSCSRSACDVGDAIAPVAASSHASTRRKEHGCGDVTSDGG